VFSPTSATPQYSYTFYLLQLSADVAFYNHGILSIVLSTPQSSGQLPYTVEQQIVHNMRCLLEEVPLLAKEGCPQDRVVLIPSLQDGLV
jgi:hypothetical protein